jgi:hypothetical protein
MGRGKTSKTVGCSSDFSGEKEAWLDSFKDQIVGKDKQAVGDAYTDVTTRFLMRYGYDLPFGENVDGDPEDNPPPAAPKPMPADEKTHRETIRVTLRQVGYFYLFSGTD